MGKQRYAGYEPITPGVDQLRFDQKAINRARIDDYGARARKQQEDALKEHLTQYEDDPYSQALAAAEFNSKQDEEAVALKQKEHDRIASEYDDPFSKALAIAEHYAKQREEAEKAPEAKKAFAENELLQRIKEEENTSRKLDRAGLGFSPLRETIGSAVQVVPGLASVVARAGEGVGLIEEKAADELNRQSGAFGQARELSREGDMIPYLSRMYGGASQSLLQMAATPGGAMSKIVGAGVTSGNEALTTAEDAGLKGTGRLRYAGSQAFFEAGIAALGQKLFGAGIESRLAGQAVAAETWKQLAKNIGVDALKEMPEEVLTSILQDLSSKYEGVSPDLTLGDFVQNSVDAAVQSAMMAAMGNAPNAGRIMLRGQPSPPIEPGEKLLNPDVSESAPAVTPEPATEAASPVVEQTPEPQPIAPAIEAFLNKPESAFAYEAAVKAGLPAIAEPNRKNRAKYAAYKRKELSSVANPQPVVDPVPTTTAPAVEASSGTVPNDELEMLRSLYEGDQNGEESNVEGQLQGSQGNSEAGENGTRQEGQVEGRQEGLLNQPEVVTPADSQQSPAAHTKETFAAEYNDLRSKLADLGQSPEAVPVRERLAEMFDAQTEWASELEQTTPSPVVGPGEASPDQSLTPAADPVSTPEATPVATGVPSPEQSPKEAVPVSPQEPRRGVVGGMLSSGEIVKTSSGRSTTPFPKIDVSTNRKAGNTVKRVDEWLHANALAEAESRGDDFNATQFRNEKPGKMPPATKDSMEEYLFGEQPKVVPSILKPLTVPTESTATTPVPAFAALPQKSQDLFNKAFESKDVESLKQMVQKNNVSWNSEFTNRTGIKLPKTQKGRFEAVSTWAKGDITATLRDIVDGRPVTLYHGSYRSEPLTELKAGSSMTTHLPTAEKFGKTGMVYEGKVSIPSDSPIAWRAKELLADIESGKITPEEANAKFDGAVTEYRTTETVPVTAKPTPTAEPKPPKAPAPAEPTEKSLVETQENKAKAETPPADSQPELSEVEQATLAALMESLAPNQKPVKAEKKPRAPKAAAESQPAAEKKPRSKVGQATAKAKEATSKGVKDAFADFMKDMRDQKMLVLFPGAPPVMNPKAIASAVRLTAALAKNGVVTFADFATLTVENIGAEVATKLAPYLETAWTMLKRVPGYEGVDEAGRISDFIGEENAKDATTSDTSMEGVLGESGGTLAETTGGTSEGGNTKAATGSDGNAVSGGTDGTTEAESEGGGEFIEGNGTEQSSGAKPKPGRKASVKGSRKPAIAVSGAVEGQRNLRIKPEDTIAPGGVVSKLKANIAAIKLLKTLQAEGRPATESEQKVLMQYTGWGSLQHVFDENKGKEFIERPGLNEQYGEWYKKSLLYQKKGEYSSLAELQKRVEAWEKQWGESYKYLKENLTKDEWKKAAASVLNAHFTSRDVITNGIWGALERMGVTGGRFMEPSSGIGSLIGLMPETIASNSEVIAIELDSLTGDMVKQLYPEADVHVKGFEEVSIPAGTIDIAATNVPFHQIGPSDAKTRYGRDMNLHNYFIARILDSLRPGGLAAVITTHFTMDANPQDRALLAGKADLVGAIRLPNSAFKANAGTEVTTDILFFRKPDGSSFKGEAWQNLASVGTYTFEAKKTKKGPMVEQEGNITVNEYFAAHPEMVLGTHSMDGSQYSDTEYTVMPIPGADIASQLQKAVANLPAGVATADNAPLMPSLDTGTTGVEGRIEFRGGKLQELVSGEWQAPSWLKDAMTLTKDGKPRKMKDETKAKKIADAVTQGIAYSKVRNAYEVHLANMRNEATTQDEYEQSLKVLNSTYDAYRAKHGPLNGDDSSWLERDPGFFFASGLEVEVESVENGELAKGYGKADVFRERTVNPDAAPKKADTTEDAVKMSLAWRGAINLPWMSELTGTSEEDLEAELLDSGTVFQNPETSLLEPADTYLSGNVQAKLRAAEQAVSDGDKRFEKNVELLKLVQPPKMTIDSITPSLGSNWVPNEVVDQWLDEIVKLPNAAVRYNAKADVWNIRTGGIPRDVQNEWGTLGMHLSDLLPKVLNGSTIRVMKKAARIGDDGRVREVDVVDEAQTQAAQIKGQKLRDSFESWAKSNETAIPLIERAFNEQKNFYVKPQYNGEHLTFPGMSDMWLKRMRPYQKNTIWRAIREGRGMIAHGVGAGKTLEMIAIAMEMKRLGTATKPMLVVQNSTLGQFARTFTEVYPAAKVLVASKEDLNPENRAKFMARIATGNWDAIVMAKSTFNMKLPNDPALEKAMVEGLIDELKDIMLEAQLQDGAGSPSVKAIQQQINSLIKRLDKIIDRVNSRTDSDVFFEQMGVDALFLDEAHDYKKPPFVTKLDRSIKGLATDTSGRALSALIKMRFIQGNNQGRNTFMATGTPITNTLGESWLLMNMVAPDVLAEFGVRTFDQFVSTFARVITSLETNAVGKLGRKTRLAKFKNGHQLAQFIQSGWDVLLGDDLHNKIREYGGGKIPKIDGGKETLHMVDRSQAFDKFGKFFLNVYDAYKKLEGEDKAIYSWIPVVIYGAAKAAAIDVRLVDPTAPDDPGSKLNKMVEGVFQAYQEGTNVELQAGDQTLTGQNLTQLIFSDTSGRTSIEKLREFAAGTGVTMEIDEDDDSESDSGDDSPSTSKTKEDRWLYNEIKNKLITLGVPEDQVQLINDHNSTAEKLLAFQDRVSRGEVRIVIGHSDTLGTGVNVQPRLRHIWELDIPMVPAKREQRIGRGIRSGNMNESVGLHVMAMQRSLDGTLMSMNLRKAKAAEQALSGKAGAEFDDPYSESLMSMADMEAAMNDDPLFYRQRDLEFQVRSLRLEAEALDQQRSRERSRLRDNERTIDRLQEEISKNELIANKVEAAINANHPFSIEGQKIASLKDAEKELKKNYDAESDKISKATQNSKIKAIRNYWSPESENVAADAEFGPIQFNLIYGEHPEVVQDEKGNPTTKWTSTSGTIITMGGKKIEETKATTLSTIMTFLKGSVPDTRSRIISKQKNIDDLKAENAKLAEFLAKPSDTQIELDNLESQLNQVNQLMFDRDNPSSAPAGTPDDATQAADPSDRRQSANDAQAAVEAQKAENAKLMSQILNITRNSALGGGLPNISKELADLLARRTLGAIKLGIKQFDAFIKTVRADVFESGFMSEEELSRQKQRFIQVWNAARKQFGLDEATEQKFDAAMSNAADVEQLSKAIRGDSPSPDPATLEPATEAASEATYSTKNAFTDSERDRLGIAKRQPKERQRNEPLVDLAAAMAKTEQGRLKTDELIAELTVRPRATSPLENHQLTIRYAQLDQKYEAALEERNAARRIGDDATEAIAEHESGLFLKEQTELLELLSGDVSYFLGAGLQARKTLINRDFSMARSVLEFEAAYGRKPNHDEKAAMEKQIADLAAANAELQRLLDERDSSIDDLNTKLKEAHDAAVNQKPQSRFAAAKERAQKKVNDAWAEVMGTLSMTKTNAQIVPYQNTVLSMVKLAGAYVELGVVSLPDFLDRVRKRMGPEAEKLIPQFTQGWNDFQASRTNDELEQITDKIDPMDDDTIGRAARDLHRFVIQRDGLDASAEGRNAAVVAVYEIMRDKVEGITEDQVARAMSGIGVYSELNKDEIEVIRRDQKAQLMLLEQIGDWKKGQAPPATGQERPPVSDEQRALRKVVNQAKKDAGIVTTTEGQLRSALDAAKRLAKNRISDLTKAIEKNKPISRNEKILKDDGSPEFAELTALRAERDALQKLYDQAFGKGQLSDEQRANAAEKALDRAISKMEADLASGKLYSDPAKAPVSSPAIEAKRAALDALKASREELRLSSGEAQARSDAAYERHLLEKDAELARRLAENDFMPPGKKPARELTPEMKRKMLEIQKKEEALLKRKKEWEFENRHPIYKFWKTYPVQGMSMVRKGLTTIDQSLIGRQGWLLGLAHPILYGKSIKKAFGSNWLSGKSIFPTEQDLFNAEQELDADADWVRLEKIAKLAVTGVHGGMKKAEENNSDVPEWFDKIPGIGGSERAGSAFINTQRRLVFRQLVSQLATRQEANGPSSVSTADLRVIANLINVSSGRATLGEHENAIKLLTTVFFSPRWWASRLMWLSGQPMWSNAKWAKGEGVSKEARQLVMKEWATQAATQAAVMTIAVAGLIAAFGEPGDDEEWDWYMNWSNPNFGRIRIGSTYIDMTAGLGQHIALFGQMYTGKRIDRWETKDVDKFRMVSNQIRGKLAPMPGIFADWLDGQSISQEPFGSTEWYASKAIPLSIQDVAETFKQEGVELGSIVSMLMFFGMGAQTREAKVKSRTEAVNEIRAMRKQGKSPETIQAALNKHLKYTAALEAKEKLRTASPDEKAALESVVAGDSASSLESAMAKERQDIALRAIERLSAEDTTGKKAAKDDASITTARALMKDIAPTYKEAETLFKAAYKARHGMLVEQRVGPNGYKQWVEKESVTKAKRRLKAMYAK